MTSSKRLTEIRSDCDLAVNRECVSCRCSPRFIWTNYDEIYLVCGQRADELMAEYSEVDVAWLDSQ